VVGDRGGSGGLDRVEADGESQGVGLAGDAVHGAFGLAGGEVVTSQIAVVDVVGEHVSDRGQDGMFQSDDRFLLAQAG
jgi:hypothetical protein